MCAKTSKRVKVFFFAFWCLFYAQNRFIKNNNKKRFEFVLITSLYYWLNEKVSQLFQTMHLLTCVVTRGSRKKKSEDKLSKDKLPAVSAGCFRHLLSFLQQLHPTKYLHVFLLTALWRIWMLCTISILLTFSYCCFRKDVSNHYLQKKVLLINFSKISIFSHFLLIEGYGKDVMCNELVIATFIERFKIATLTKPYWYISLPLKAICLTISFFLTFCWKKTINRVLYQSIQTLVLS